VTLYPLISCNDNYFVLQTEPVAGDYRRDPSVLTTHVNHDKQVFSDCVCHQHILLLVDKATATTNNTLSGHTIEYWLLLYKHLPCWPAANSLQTWKI